MNKIYTGIGSRKTPDSVLWQMYRIAKAFSAKGWMLRSGGAKRADDAFESGAIYKSIYLPWDGFNKKKVNYPEYYVPDYNKDFVFRYHPNPYKLSERALKLMSRNSYQVLGDDLHNPLLSDCVVCYTVDGRASGGTGQALRIAKDYNIPIYNLYYSSDYEKLLRDYEIGDYL